MVVRYLTDDDIDLAFHALADVTRRDILASVIRGECSVSTLAQRYPMSFAGVQKHVAVLTRASLVTKQRRGREQIVRADMATLRQALAVLESYEEIWRQRVTTIERKLAEDPDAADEEPSKGGKIHR